MTERILIWLAKLSRRGDLVVAALMLVAVTMILIPLPTFLVDILITANIAISVLILLAALYITHPLQFSSLPAVILISTIFRLAITITTARLILLQADAGDIINAFGNFVVGGNVIVGLVTFLIITIAQFVVIAKGAERVAEVAARFTLDALPGKQMSIDAELRNGDISQVEARTLRQQLERESQLYGAMDGAMKFVKGDIIANIIVILVNLIGGIAIGTIQRGMALGDAASTYSLLTVGDGLVAQIPALLVGVAAATMVTRVATTDGQGDLGRQVMQQLLRDPRAVGLAAAIMMGLSLVPGFPTFVFLLLGGVLAAGAFVLHRRNARLVEGDAELRPAQLQRDTAAVPASENLLESKTSYQIVVGVGREIDELIPRDLFEIQAQEVRREVSSDLGIDIPALGFDPTSKVAGRHLRIDLDGAPILDVEIPSDRVLVEADPTNLELAGVQFERAGNTLQRKAYWVDSDSIDKLQDAGIAFLTSPQAGAKWLERALRLYAGHFIGIQETRKLLSGMEDNYGDLVRQAQETLTLQKIAEILRRLVEENVPVRNLRIILEAIVEWGGRDQEVAALTEHVRAALKRQISYRVADSNNIIASYILERSTEDLLRKAVRKTASGTFLDLSEEDTQAIAGQLEEALASASSETLPVVVTASDVRRHLYELLTHHAVDISVLSYQEFAPEFNVQPLATIGAGKPKRAGNDDQARLTTGIEREQVGAN